MFNFVLFLVNPNAHEHCALVFGDRGGAMLQREYFRPRSEGQINSKKRLTKHTRQVARSASKVGNSRVWFVKHAGGDIQQLKHRRYRKPTDMKKTKSTD